MSDKPLIVLVEDDAVIAELIQYNLTSEGYEVLGFRNGKAMFEALPGAAEISLFILDVMLPGMDGFEICRQIRESGRYPVVPVIMLTARGTETDKVTGLQAGADDYITKPFGIRELLARIQAHVRRYNTTVQLQNGTVSRHSDKDEKPALSAAAPEPAENQHVPHPGTMEYAGILLDDIRHRVYAGGREIEMTNREYELLKFLMQNRGVAYSRDDLLNHV